MSIGKMSYMDILSMPTYLRDKYYEFLYEDKMKEKEMIDEMENKNKSL